MGAHVERKAIRKAAIFAAISFAACCAVFVPTQPAWAGIAEDINGWLCDMLRGVCNWVFAAQVDVLKSIGYDGILGAGFQNMLGTSGDVSVYDVVRGIWSVAVLPIGCGVLSLVFTIKLIQISQRMDGSASMPGVKEVVFLLVFFAVFLFLMQNSFDLMTSLYEVVGTAIRRAADLFGTGSAMDLAKVSIVTTDDDVAALVAMLVVSLVSWLVVLVAYIVSLVVCWARAIQLYVLAMLAPIPLAHGARRDAPGGRRIHQELRLGVPCGPRDTRAAHSVPPSSWAAWWRPTRNRHADRRDSQRAHLRAAVPGHVRPAGALAREERLVGKGRHERLLAKPGRPKGGGRDGMTRAGRPRR